MSRADEGRTEATRGLPAEASLAAGRERLLYGSLEDVGGSGFGVGDVLFVPHPAVLPVDFAWPPTAAPARERIG